MMYPKTWATGLLVMAIPAVLFGAGYWIGAKVESSVSTKEKLELEKQNTRKLGEAFKNYEAELELQRKLNKEVISEYLDEKSQIERKYRELSGRGSLRIPRSVCNPGAVPTSASSEPSVAEETTTTIALPNRIEQDLRRLVKEADEVTAQCRALASQVAQ